MKKKIIFPVLTMICFTLVGPSLISLQAKPVNFEDFTIYDDKKNRFLVNGCKPKIDEQCDTYWETQN